MLTDSLELDFSKWVITKRPKTYEDVFNTQKMTVEVVNWMHEQGGKSMEAGMVNGIPVIELIVGAYLSGLNDAWLFIHDQVQNEKDVI